MTSDPDSEFDNDFDAAVMEMAQTTEAENANSWMVSDNKRTAFSSGSILSSVSRVSQAGDISSGHDVAASSRGASDSGINYSGLNISGSRSSSCAREQQRSFTTGCECALECVNGTNVMNVKHCAVKTADNDDGPYFSDSVALATCSISPGSMET